MIQRVARDVREVGRTQNVADLNQTNLRTSVLQDACSRMSSELNEAGPDRILPADFSSRHDSAIATAAANALEWDSGTGTVRSLAERDDAKHAAWAAPGVTKVDDRLAVTRDDR